MNANKIIFCVLFFLNKTFFSMHYQTLNNAISKVLKNNQFLFKILTSEEYYKKHPGGEDSLRQLIINFNKFLINSKNVKHLKQENINNLNNDFKRYLYAMEINKKPLIEIITELNEFFTYQLVNKENIIELLDENNKNLIIKKLTLWLEEYTDRYKKSEKNQTFFEKENLEFILEYHSVLYLYQDIIQNDNKLQEAYKNAIILTNSILTESLQNHHLDLANYDQKNQLVNELVKIIFHNKNTRTVTIGDKNTPQKAIIYREYKNIFSDSTKKALQKTIIQQCEDNCTILHIPNPLTKNDFEKCSKQEKNFKIEKYNNGIAIHVNIFSQYCKNIDETTCILNASDLISDNEFQKKMIEIINKKTWDMIENPYFMPNNINLLEKLTYLIFNSRRYFLEPANSLLDKIKYFVKSDNFCIEKLDYNDFMQLNSIISLIEIKSKDNDINKYINNKIQELKEVVNEKIIFFITSIKKMTEVQVATDLIFDPKHTLFNEETKKAIKEKIIKECEKENNLANNITYLCDQYNHLKNIITKIDENDKKRAFFTAIQTIINKKAQDILNQNNLNGNFSCIEKFINDIFYTHKDLFTEVTKIHAIKNIDNWARTSFLIRNTVTNITKYIKKINKKYNYLCFLYDLIKFFNSKDNQFYENIKFIINQNFKSFITTTSFKGLKEVKKVSQLVFCSNQILFNVATKDAIKAKIIQECEGDKIITPFQTNYAIKYGDAIEHLCNQYNKLSNSITKIDENDKDNAFYKAIQPIINKKAQEMLKKDLPTYEDINKITKNIFDTYKDLFTYDTKLCAIESIKKWAERNKKPGEYEKEIKELEKKLEK